MAETESTEDKKSDSTPPSDKESEPEAKEPEKPAKKKFHWTPLKVVVVVVVVLLVAVLGTIYYIYSSHHETTDDAYATGHIHTISSRVSGTVISVDVDDNQHVKAGQVLVRLDPRDYQVQVDKAQADYDRAQADYERVAALKDDIAISRQDYDQSDTNMRTAKANLDDAKNQLSYCTITAPTDGTIGNKTVQTGNRVIVGGALMSVVQDLWILANYKETQVGQMRVGQRVKISVDEFPDHAFYGFVNSFSPGAGSSFALLPPDNATGNFTKIVQRIPVKILFDPDSIRGYEDRLSPGISVEVNVDLTSRPQAENQPNNTPAPPL